MISFLKIFLIVFLAVLTLVLALALTLGLTAKASSPTTSGGDDDDDTDSPSPSPLPDAEEGEVAAILGHTDCVMSCSEEGHTDPGLQTNCVARCAPIVCTGEGASTCRVRCPPDQAASESCPSCEIVCDAFALCEATNCEWDCAAPTYTDEQVPPGVCGLLCDSPACEYSDAQGWTTTGVEAPAEEDGGVEAEIETEAPAEEEVQEGEEGEGEEEVPMVEPLPES